MTAQINTPRTTLNLTAGTPLIIGLVASAALEDRTFNVLDMGHLNASTLAVQYVVHRTRADKRTGCWIVTEGTELHARSFGMAMMEVTHEIPESRIMEPCRHSGFCANPAHLVVRPRTAAEEIPEDEWTAEDEANCTTTYHTAR